MAVFKKFGWPLSEDVLFSYFGDDLPDDSDSIHKMLLDSDMREIVGGVEHAATGRSEFTNENGDIVIAPLILQIQKVRNVAVPKQQDMDSTSSARLLRLALTDGKTSFSALEMSTVKGLHAKTPPGTKLQLTGSVQNERGFLLLSPSNCRVLGGQVEKLIEKWQLKNPGKLTRRGDGDGQSGPPPWVPFGQKPRISNDLLSSSLGNLRVMDLAASSQQAAPAVSEEFNQARQNVIAQAIKQQEKSIRQIHS